MNVYLVRHTSVNVPKGTCYGQTDVPLKDTFEQEALLVYEQLKSISFDKAYTSPLSRCVRLASFCGFEDAEKDDRLKEVNFGDWEMQRFDEIKDPRLQEWYDDYIHVRTTNGESFTDQYNRVAAFLSELKEKNYKNVVIFAHGGVLIDAEIFAKHFALEHAFEHLRPYGSVIKIEI